MPIAKTQWTKVIEAEDMIGMRMGIQNRINIANVLPQSLFAKIRTGVDQYAVIVPCDGY